MWDDSTQPSPQVPHRQPSPYQPPYPDGADTGFGNAPTERYPDMTGSTYDPYDQPTPYQPQRPQYPAGRPPEWPGSRYQPPPAQPRYEPDYAAPPPPPRRYNYSSDAAAYAVSPPARAAHQPRSLPHLPIAHVLLIAGVLAMGYAVSQPWGMDATGAQLFIHDFSNARLAAHDVDASALAVRAAYGIVAATAALSVGLILLNTVVTILNKMLGIVGLPGCASLVFFPVLWGGATLLFVALLAGAGFAGLGSLSNLPVVQDHGFSLVAVQHYAIGFYLWCGGLAAVFFGMLGQLVLRRR